jgi:predicted DNA-binding WGR domain protein
VVVNGVLKGETARQGLSGAEPDPGERTRCLSVKNTPAFSILRPVERPEGFGGYFPRPLAFDRTGGQHGGMQTTQTEVAELVKLHPAKRQARFYRLEIWPDLFGGFSLAREYGRIGQPGRLQLDPFPALDPACKAFARIVRTKQRRGYVPLPCVE